MTQDEARAILITAFVSAPDLPPDIQQALAKLIIPPKRKGRWRR